jgi:CIC family chloride channel protein
VHELIRLRRFFSKSFDYKTQILIRVAIIGVVIGCVAVALRRATEFLFDFFYKDYYVKEHWYDWLYLPLVCMCGGLLASYLTVKFAPDASGSGIPHVKHVLGANKLSISLKTVVVKFFGNLVALATGLSCGREGPSVQIGAGIGAKLSKLLGGKHRKRAIASGAGAGLAAAFNTPIAGVMFVIEELDKNFSSTALGPAIVGSVSAAITCRVLAGDFFTFHFQSDMSVGLAELPFYALNGVLAGIFGVYFQRSVLWSLDFYKKYLSNLPKWSWGAVAGLVTGIVGLWIPQALGGGHSTLEGVLAGAYSWWFIPVIFAGKYFLTLVAYGSGIPGGIFMPALILGALGASILGQSLDYVFPSLDINPANFAFVGMGAFFTAISRAPITSIVMLFELTGNYQLVLPLMFACIVANISAERLKQGSIYENLLQKLGVDLKEYAPPSYLERFSVEDVMTKKVDTITSVISLAETKKIFSQTHHSGFPILDPEGKLVGVITKQDLQKADMEQISSATLISQIMSKDLKYVYSTDNLHTAILKFYENKIGRLLVVEENNPGKLLGIMTRSDIINFEASQELDY